MLIVHYLVFGNNYEVHNFNFGTHGCVTIFKYSWYVSMIWFKEKNKDVYEDDDRQKLALHAINTSKCNWHRYVLRELRYWQFRGLHVITKIVHIF
jgi:hypothetical protein